MAELGQATFFDYVRGSRTAENRQLAADGSPRLQVTIGLSVAGVRSSGETTENVETTLQVLGPADVIGVAPTEILRVFPAAGEPAAEPNYLASIEFDSTELPWLVSLATDESKPMPWIALVVVPDADARMSFRAGSPLQWLSVETRKLPPCSQSWAWAHAQVIGNTDDPQSELGDGRRTLSRLLCPTRLEENSRYLAAVVPTYKASVVAARGESTKDVGAALAWEADGQIALPVYYSWRFATGPGGDFEQLARQLRPVDADTLRVGSFALRVADGGLGPVPFDTPIHALRTLLTTERELDAMAEESAEPPIVAEALTRAVNPATGEREDRVVRPPRYGQFPAGDVPATEGPPWFGGLNLTPSNRVIARVGADVVRAHQEELVADAQRQLGAYQRARRARDHLRLGELSATRLHRRTLDERVAPGERVLAVARPALDQLASGMEQPVADILQRQGLGVALLAPSLARVAQRAGRRTAFAAGTLRARLVSGMLDGTLVKAVAPPERQSVDLDRLRRVYRRADILERPIGQLTVDKVLTLAEPASSAQQELIAQFAGKRVIVQEVAPEEAGPLVVHPHEEEPHVVVHPLGHGLGAVGPAALHVAALDVASPEPGVEIHAVNLVALGLQHVESPVGAAFDPFRRLPEAVAVARVPVAELALGDAAASSMHAALGALTGLGVEPAAAEPTISDLVVDETTVTLAKQLSVISGVAAEPALVAFDPRTAVRRQLGFSSAQPVLRDQLVADEQQRFDEVVDLVGKRLLAEDVRFPEPPPPVTVAGAAEPCRTGLLATATYTAAAARLLPFAAGLAPTAIPMGFVPRFSAPLVARLARSLDRWILAGAESIPPNSVTMLVTNPAFVEALVAGANHEMARELLWRDIPSDPRGSVFEQFWTDDPMPAIHTWTSPLGENLETGNDPFVAVVLRSPLLRRYPNAVIYAARGVISNDNFEPDADPPRTPLYTGFIRPDITFSVINLKRSDARDPQQHWYLLLAEPVGEPRFGLDAAPDGERGPLTSWRDLAWTDATDPDTDRPVHLLPDKPPGGNATLDGLQWGESSAHLARILHQDPFRVVLRAHSFLDPGSG